MQRRQMIITLLAASLAPLARAGVGASEPVVGLPCDGCEAAFVGMPGELGSQSRIAPLGEPGEPLTLRGQVLDPEGHPRAGIIVYAYHTDSQGIYPRASWALWREAARHGRLRAWVKTDAQGNYRFDTIRPGSYPGRDVPQHIHMHVIEPGRATYYIDDVMFRDDPKLTPKMLAQLNRGRGGSGIVVPESREGTWQAIRNIVLGENIPGYPAGIER